MPFGSAFWGPVVGSAISGSLGFASAKQVNDQAKNLADTRYQRTVMDMKKAGLNPILATGSGSTAGSVPQLTNPADSAIKGITETANSAANYTLKKQLADKAVIETENAVKQGEYLDAQTQKAIADTNYVNTSAQGVAADNKKKEAKGGFWSDVGDMYHWASGKAHELGDKVHSSLSYRVPKSETGDGKVMGLTKTGKIVASGTTNEHKPLEIYIGARKNKHGDWTAQNPDGSWNNGLPARR